MKISIESFSAQNNLIMRASNLGILKEVTYAETFCKIFCQCMHISRVRSYACEVCKHIHSYVYYYCILTTFTHKSETLYQKYSY